MAVSPRDAQTRRRRWFGALCLLAAIAMLAAGEWLLKGRLAPIPFLVYWLTCLGFVLLAVYAALADLRAMRQKSYEEQRGLLEKTLLEIEQKKQSRKPDGGENGA